MERTNFSGEDNKNESTKIMNRKYKDSLFRKLFNNKNALADLYESLKPGVEVDVQKMDIITLDNALTNDYYNDIGFMYDNRLIVLVEEQSTVCLNMPLRMLIYLTHTYEEYIKEHNLKVHGVSLQKLPTPEFYVISTTPCKQKVLQLSDAFLQKGKPFIELTVPIITKEEYRTMSSLKSYLDFVHSVEYNYRT